MSSGAAQAAGLRVRDELEQAAVRIPEVDALTASTCAQALDRAFLDVNAMLLEVPRRVVDRTRPDEADVGVAGPHGIGGTRMGVDPGPWTFSCWSPKRYANRP